MEFLLLSLALIFSILFEATLIQLPLVLLVLFIFAIIYQKEWIFPFGVLSGLVLDGLMFHPLGSSSIFFSIFLFIIFLYEKKFELRSIWFIISMSLVGSLLFLFFFGSVRFFIQLLLSVGFSVVLFFLFSLIHPLPDKDTLKTWKR